MMRTMTVVQSQRVTVNMKTSNSTLPRKSPILRSLREDLISIFMNSLAEFEELAHAGSHMGHRPDLAHALLEDAFNCRSSDIHLEPRTSETRIRLRIDGAVVDVASLTHEQAKWLVNQFKTMANLDPVVRFTPQDAHARCRLEELNIDLRLALAPCQSGEALSIRVLDHKRLEHSIDDLGLTDTNLEQLEDWLENVNGMFLSVGPTGSGKTTTIYSLLHELKFADRTVVSLEDPVEYEINGITQVQLDQKHHLSFAEGVKAMLRLDPDFLMIGEIRDAPSAKAAVDAAITGRVLLSTVHARDAIATVTALRNWGLADHEISESLVVVVAQRLVRKLCHACRQPAPATENELRWLHSLHLPTPVRLWKPVGCEHCNQLGYTGRTGIFELWHLDASDYEMILSHIDEHSLRQHVSRRSHSSLIRDGLAKVATGTTSLAELRRSSGGILPLHSPQVQSDHSPIESVHQNPGLD
jgi:general secretion pathway protein E